MTINHAILGILSYRPMSGYDLKKVIQDSLFMHWSGNNNQIYKALLELLEEGLVTGEVVHQENPPSKKIYTITSGGLDTLKAWTACAPEPASFRKSFLIQLAWADLLCDDALRELLRSYEEEIRLQLVMAREKIRRGSAFAARSGQEAFLWRMINENVLSSYQSELAWVERVLGQLPAALSGEVCKDEPSAD